MMLEVVGAGDSQGFGTCRLKLSSIVLMYGPEPLNPRHYGNKKAAPVGASRDE